MRRLRILEHGGMHASESHTFLWRSRSGVDYARRTGKAQAERPGVKLYPSEPVVINGVRYIPVTGTKGCNDCEAMRVSNSTLCDRLYSAIPGFCGYGTTTGWAGAQQIATLKLKGEI